MPSGTSWRVKVWIGNVYVTTYSYSTEQTARHQADGFRRVGCLCQVEPPENR